LGLSILLFKIKNDFNDVKIFSFVTIYTDSYSNLLRYKDDFYRIAVSSTLPFKLQHKMDAWFYDLSPSKDLTDKLEREELNINEYSDLYLKEMNAMPAISNIKWIKDYSRRNDVVLLCYEPENINKCHRHILKKIIESY
jgi:uncharacterized protein YeaO (DUF488 family)